MKLFLFTRMSSLIWLGVLATVMGIASPAEAQSSVAPLMRMLQSGRLPAERMGNVIELICRRGQSDDLQYIYQQAVSPDGFPPEVRREALEALADTARTRRVRPAGDLSGLDQLLAADQDDTDRLTAIRLAGLWKVQPLAGSLQELVLDAETPDPLQRAALDALVAMGAEASREVIGQLTAADRPHSLRALGITGLARLDLEQAATLAVELLGQSDEGDDPAPVIRAFLDRQGGAEKLAAALVQEQPPADVAKLALRSMYATGRTDAPLVNALTQAAGLHATVTLPPPEELQEMVTEVLAQGSAERGEQVFRREDLSCLKCHAVSGAGGNVGPDLSAIGSSSPIDFIIQEILVPNRAIKEGFVTTNVFTEDGRVLQGIVVDRDEQRIVLRDASGKETAIAQDDIEELHEGGSLMPQGLVNFMTRSELLDLVRFLAELGKPGEYAIRSTPTMQRWRVLQEPPEELASTVPDAETFRSRVLQAGEEAWQPAYAMVAGTLPLQELLADERSPQVLYLQGEVEVTVGGLVGFEIDSTAPTHVWVNDQPLETERRITAELPRGRHAITLRVDTTSGHAGGLKVEFFKVPSSTAEYTVVGGR